MQRDSAPNHQAPWERDLDHDETPRHRPQPRVAMRDDYEQDYARKPARKKQSFSVLSYLFARPLESVAFGSAACLCLGIAVNALFMQSKPSEVITQQKPAEIVAAVKPTLPETRFSTAPVPEPVARFKVASPIEEAQRELSRRGIYNDTIDGKPGSKTEKAVKEYQRSIGMKPTGEINDELLYALRPSADKKVVASLPKSSAIGELVDTLPSKKLDTMPTASGAPSVKRIYYVEKSLADMAYGPITVDGVFGEDTRQAIMKFEQARNLRPRGEITDRLLKEIAAVTGQPLE
jgi:peptidoglycan hydrolase-like protein with peptidoglycan-binding domain